MGALLAAQFRPAAPVDPSTLSGSGFGYLHNIQDLTSLRQDNIDTAAAVGSPVGMVFDRFLANTLGTDTVTNGDFPTATTGWTGASATLSIVTATLKVANSGAAAGRAHQSQTTVVGTTYKVTVDLVENANGAAIAVGTSNSTSTLFLLTIAAGTTGSYTFYFIASTTTSFIQLRTTSTTSGHFTRWDNVVCKSIAGTHVMQQTSTARQILRQDALGHYYLENDGVDDFLLGGLSITSAVPGYLAACIRRMDGGATATRVYNLNASGTRRFGIGNTASNMRCSGIYQDTAVSATTANSDSNVWADGRLIVVDSLVTTTTVDVCNGRKLPNSVALGATPVPNTLCASGIHTNTGLTAALAVNHFYGGCYMGFDPGVANRAGVRTWLANLAGAD